MIVRYVRNGSTGEITQGYLYVPGYAIERVLSMSRKGINGFLTKKATSQQLNLFEYFKIENTRVFAF